MWFRSGVPLALALSLIASLAMPSTAHADEGGDRARWAGLKYVALGDGFAAGPNIPNQQGGCGRSDHNYPNEVNRAYEPDAFVDVSCIIATTRELYETQFYMLKPDTNIVSLSIGFNDLKLNGLLRFCGSKTLAAGSQQPTGAPCKAEWLPGGQQAMDRAIANTEREIGLALDEIHKRSPKANVFLVGYPALVPDDGRDCYPYLPLSNADVAWLSQWVQSLNAALYRAADTHSEAYVDTYSFTRGHDICQPPASRWVEGIDFDNYDAPIYVNAAGMAEIANRVIVAFA